VNPNEKVLQQDHIGVSRVKPPGPSFTTASTLAFPPTVLEIKRRQPTSSGVSHAVDNATSGAEEYVVSTPTALETRRLRRTRAYMQHALDCYPKNVLRMVNPVKLKNEKQCSFSEELVKTKDVDKKDDQCQVMEKPVKAKTVTWMLRGATKAMSTMITKSGKAVLRVTLTQSKWRIWDPGRSEADVLREVIVRNKHEPRPARQWCVYGTYTRVCPGRISIHIRVYHDCVLA
jgi:hypothetical protein